MDEQRWWRHGPPWGAARWPWRSTLLVTVFVLGGSTFASHSQPDRVHLDFYARVLLIAGSVLLLWRHRCPVWVAFGTVFATVVYPSLSALGETSRFVGLA